MGLHTAIIMNPSANDWEAKKKWPSMVDLLKKQKIKYDLVETQPDRPTVEITKEVTEQGYKRIIAVGGDGTINEVLNGIMKAKVSKRPKLALFPFGTANDVSKSFNIIVGNLEDMVGTLVDGLDYPLDLGLVNEDIYFADCFSIGFEATVLKDRNLTREDRLIMSKGFESYVPSAIKKFLFHKTQSASIDIDETNLKQPIYSLIVKNTRVYVGAFILNERIRGNDGKLDVFLFQDAIQFWAEFGTQITKQVSTRTDITGISKNIVDIVIKNYKDFQAKNIEINLSDKMDSQLDGEQFKTDSHFMVECIPKAITLQVPYPY